MMMQAAAAKQIPSPSSILPVLYDQWRLGPLRCFEQLWQRYGDLFCLKLGARDLVLVIHPDAVRHINHTHRQNYEKLGSYDLVRKFLTGQGLLASTGELWKRQRKLMAPFYTPKAVHSYAALMLQEGERLAARWEQLAAQQKNIELSDEMTFVTAAIILKAMFSTEAKQDITSIKESVETMIAYVSRQLLPVRTPLWIPTPHNRAYVAARSRVHSYIQHVLALRRAIPEAQWPQDLLTKLMQARDEEDGSGMSAELLRDESITTFFAGHETTARTLTFAWYALASNPHVAAKLHAELDAVLGTREPTVADLHHLPYTLQVIKETLRLYPPAPFYIRDAIAEDVIDGYAVRKGAAMMLSPYFTHRHPTFWPEPLRFEPDRFTPEAESKQHPAAYHPFALGQRVCIGNNFSLLESHLLLALLARRFTVRLPSGYVPQWVMRGTLGLSNGLPALIERRA